MIRVRQVKVNINNENELLKKVASKLKVKESDIKLLKIRKRSIDARKKPELYYIYEVDVKVDNEDKILKKNFSSDILKTPNEKYIFEVSGTKKLKYRPVIVGSGPAGLYAAYMLAKYGYNPLIIERGENVDDRIKTVEKFWNDGILNTNSNVQFGEGGAGTFSDGKLNTLVKDSLYRGRKVLEIFVESGAPEDILYENKPHIGTDLLRVVIRNLRNKIIEMGGEFKYNTCLTDIEIENNKISKIQLNDNNWINTEVLILAIGHSARDTFKMLNDKKLLMLPKPFAIGIRIEHPQDMINKSQYGMDNKKLKAASYKLTYKASNNRGVYSFCMCPGGYVVNSSSEVNKIAINGMSNRARDSKNANSAIVVTVNPSDYGLNPLDGVNFQRKLEERTYEVGNGKIPVQLFRDFLDNKKSTEFKDVKPNIKGNYTLANLNDIFPDYILESLKEAIINFDKKIKGFARDDAILSAIESRTSSPIRLERNENMESNIIGIYPIGEGAGYAGGITSAAIDGIKVAEAIAKIYEC